MKISGVVIALNLIGAGLFTATAAGAQQAPIDTARCDSIVAAARKDSVNVGLFVSVARIDGGALPATQADAVALSVGSAFIPPRPFRLTVFSGPVRARLLRALASDTTAELRPPTLTGVYRFSVTKTGTLTKMVIVRASLMPGFDSAAVVAIEGAATTRALTPPAGEDSMHAEVRFATDSVAGARRIVSAGFPRMPVVSAVPLRDNPAAIFPDDEKGDSASTGEAVLRFVVDRTGAPVPETVELVRGTSLSFVRSALTVLPKQMFAPATIRGCAVAQQIDYAFSFASPARVGAERH